MSTAPSPPRQSPFGTLLLIALVLVLAWQLAYWAWRFLAPTPRPAPTSAVATVDMSAIARLFGAAPPAGATTAATTSGLRLKGVVAPTPGIAASAIFSTGTGRDIAVYIDRDVQPGIKLAEVHADHVIVTRSGARERIDLDTARTAVASATPGRPGTNRPQFKINVSQSATNAFAFSRKELDDALRDPNQLNYLGQIGQPPGGGVKMESAPPGSLAQKLGLQPGDIIKKINGQAVASPGDLARLYTQFATLTAIQAEVQRGTSVVQLSYAITP